MRLVDWLNEHLMTALGPPPTGPYEDVAAEVRGDCPVCRHPMGEHFIDHSASNTVLTCPVPRGGQFDRIEDRPLNEVGMPKRTS
ncbi:hypothetical protein FB562_1206 [Homoserinimonas aerilata]|uniref:Uncharacterized protein n=2 Tax=Homoserinimonas aerilata TaxID=1162970 RepID=A0A542YJH8_9MICO|nr:hypothetical protein FB562_1206 [Homoserinimonas aerilata]